MLVRFVFSRDEFGEKGDDEFEDDLDDGKFIIFLCTWMSLPLFCERVGFHFFPIRYEDDGGAWCDGRVCSDRCIRLWYNRLGW